MSGISTSVQVVDRVSGTLNRITAALYNTTSAFHDVDRASNTTFNTSGVQAMAQEMYSYETRIQQLEADLVSANKRLEEMEEQNKRVAQSANMLKTAYSAVKGVLVTLGVQKILDTSDALIQTTSRLDMMNDGLQSTDELVQMVYQSAQNARGSFSGMADVVARFGNNAKDAFSSNAEVVAFAELVQKQMTIAGASTSEASNAMLQLSQGLGSGVLRGDELNSIFEQAPNLVQNIADYLNVPIGEIRNMASEGELTADIVKNAIFAASDEINTKFEEMPMTWGQIWQSMQNTALMKFQPILKKINDIANSSEFQGFINGITSAMATVANIVLDIFNLVAAVGSFISNNWSLVSPIIWGIVAALAVYATYLGIVKGLEIASAVATAVMTGAKLLGAAAMTLFTGATWAASTAQMGLNSAMYACPIVWIIMLIIAIIAAIILLFNWIAKATGAADSGIGIIVGALAVAGAFVGNLFIGLINGIVDIIVVLWNFIAAFVNFFANVFTDPIGSIARLFFDLVDTILGLLETVAGVIDTLFGSSLAESVQGWRDSLGSWVDDTFGEGEEVMAKVTGEEWHLDRFEYGDAWDAGTEWGDGAADKLSNLTASLDTSSIDSAYTETDSGSVADYLSNISGDTSDIKDSVDISDENLKYLRDVAERDVINRFTTAEIKVDMQNNNTINNGMDIDGIVTQLTAGVQEAMEQAAEGVHS